MPDPVEPLILDLLEWLAPSPRRYAEVMETWRTSCPRLPVWEEANSRGFVDRGHDPERGAQVWITSRGLAHLRAARPAVAALGDAAFVTSPSSPS